MRYENIAEFDTKLTADVVEWRPKSNELACATYYLDKDKNERHGCVYVLQLDASAKKLKQVHTLTFDKSGILDLKWLDQEHLVTIDSGNSLSLLKYNSSCLKVLDSNELSPDETNVGLTLDFMSNPDGGAGFRVASSDSTGNIYLTTIDAQRMDTNEERRCHDLEIWSLLMDKSDPNLVYSGADDCTLKVWDLRQRDVAVSTCQIFEGGVTSIISPSRKRQNQLSFVHGYGPDNLICGSYDERVYVLDKRSLKRCVRESAKMEGGVWKMKLHESRDLLLCACMHTGVKLVELEHLASVLYYDKHGLNTLAYGCDWSQVDYDVAATCSFYNHSLRIWKVFS